MNKINLQNVQFLMPNNFRKYPLKQEQFIKDFQALLHKGPVIIYGGGGGGGTEEKCFSWQKIC
jgi:hypothetical protein